MGKMIRKRDNLKGFTLAEVMLAVAILIILAGVTFVGVNQYMESMALLERNGIAKEIFVAAQNHLTMAQGQGYLGTTKFGESDGIDDDGDGKADGGLYTVGLKNDSITDVMLPFGSIDETVRASGNYIIRYQKESARVLDVFYWTTNRGRYDISVAEFSSDMFSSAMKARGNDNEQKDYKGGVLGWFGGEAAADIPTRKPYQAPEIEVHNDDVLYLKVTNPNEDGELVVYVEGMESGAVGCFNYGGGNPVVKGSSKYIVLDDVANEGRLFSKIASFADIDIENGNEFIPGEDIRVYAEAYKKDTLAGIGKSSIQTTNSLFQSVETVTDENTDPTTKDTTIYIGNFRHLENLCNEKSGLKPIEIGFVEEAPVKAEQTEDLFWNSPESDTDDHHEKSYLFNVSELYKKFGVDDYKPSASKIIFGDRDSSDLDCYYPVSPSPYELVDNGVSRRLSYELVYNGAGYAVWDVNVDFVSDAGLFGSMNGGSLSNLELINFNVTSKEGNAGALAGTLKSDSNTSLKTQVTNVIAYNTDYYEKSATGNIKSGETDTYVANAGGLIGYVDSSTAVSVTACAAALYVESEGNSGGLIGQIKAPINLTGCYSGGHTIKNKAVYYDKLTDESIPDGKKINVIGGRNVGGLIGSAALQPGGSGALAGKIEQCYSTCSVYNKAKDSGLYTGGLIGQAEGGSISSCYSTGYVSGNVENVSGGDDEDNKKVSVTDDTTIISSIGQFAGILNGTTLTAPNWYYMIINERGDSTQGYSYLSPVGNQLTTDRVTAIDATVETYDDFVGAKVAWKMAHPYDSALETYYKVDGKAKYNMKTVSDLGYNQSVGKPDYIDNYFVIDHYGDWPAPEIFVINESASPSGAGE